MPVDGRAVARGVEEEAAAHAEGRPSLTLGAHHPLSIASAALAGETPRDRAPPRLLAPRPHRPQEGSDGATAAGDPLSAAPGYAAFTVLPPGLLRDPRASARHARSESPPGRSHSTCALIPSPGSEPREAPRFALEGSSRRRLSEPGPQAPLWGSFPARWRGFPEGGGGSSRSPRRGLTVPALRTAQSTPSRPGSATHRAAARFLLLVRDRVGWGQGPGLRVGRAFNLQSVRFRLV